MSSSPDYDFSPYLESLGRNWYLEDELLQRILARLAPEAARASNDVLVDFGERAAGIYRELAEAIERSEKLPTISRKDAYDRRHDHVVLPPETLRMLGEQHGARLAGGELNDLVRYAVIFVLAQNGETGTLCSLACTDGLIRALRDLGTDARSRKVLERLLGNTPEGWVHGAQFVTEVQGGSDAAANAVQAVPVGDGDLVFPVSLGPLKLARKTGAALLPCYISRARDRSFTVHITPPLDLTSVENPVAAAAIALRELGARLSPALAAQPELWRCRPASEDNAAASRSDI